MTLFIIRTDLDVGVLLSRQVEDTPRVFVKTPDDVVQSEAAVADRGEEQREHGLQTGKTRRRTLTVLLFDRVRR